MITTAHLDGVLLAELVELHRHHINVDPSRPPPLAELLQDLPQRLDDARIPRVNPCGNEAKRHQVVGDRLPVLHTQVSDVLCEGQRLLWGHDRHEAVVKDGDFAVGGADEVAWG